MCIASVWFRRIVLIVLLFSKLTAHTLYRVAVCLHGQVRNASIVLGSIADRLLLPLEADTFVYTPMVVSEATRSPSADDLQLLYALPGLRALRIENEHGNSILETLIRTYHDSDEKVSSVLNFTRQFAGNWLGGLHEPDPTSMQGDTYWRRPATGLFQMISHHRCREMVNQAESANGELYDWVVNARMDMYWEHPHIPLSFLSDDAIWIPAGMDFGGVNDKYAAIPRKSMPTYLDIYWGGLQHVARGVAAAALDEALPKEGLLNATGCDERFDGPVQQPCLNNEVWLALRTMAFKLPVKRMPGFQWTLCGGDKNADCRRNGTAFKYDEEYILATTVASCLRNKSVGRRGWVDSRVFDGAIEEVRDSLHTCWCVDLDLHRLCHRDGCDPGLFSLCSKLKESIMQVQEEQPL